MSDVAINYGNYEPDIKDAEAQKYAQTEKTEGKGDLTKDKGAAVAGTEDVLNKGQNVPKEKLSENDGLNIGKGGGVYGTFNDKDFATTQKLARQADVYNNKPTDRNVWGINNGNAQNLGSTYEKPNIETMETRTSQQAMQLDTNQKQYAQALQDAANRWDYDLFKDTFKQLYGIELDDYTAQREMSKLVRQAEIEALYEKSSQKYKAALDRYSQRLAMDALKTALQNNDYYVGYVYNSVLTGNPVSPTVSQKAMQRLEEISSKLIDSDPNADPATKEMAKLSVYLKLMSGYEGIFNSYANSMSGNGLRSK